MRGTRPRSSAPLVAFAVVGMLAAGDAVMTTAAAQQGQIIVLRDVPPRIAYREEAPAPPFAVSTTPDVDLSATRTVGPRVVADVPSITIISDLEAARISTNASISIGVGGLSGTLNAATLPLLGTGTTGRMEGASAGGLALLPHHLGTVAQGPLTAGGGDVQRATSMLGQTIRSAVVPR